MNSDHVAVALLAGPLRWGDDSDPTSLNRNAEGTPFVEFHVQTTEQRGNCRVTTSHPATAHGPTALRIATTFGAGDMVVVLGELRSIPGHRLPITSLEVKNAFRMPDVPIYADAPSLNVAYVVGTARDATATRLSDGTLATVLTVTCVSPLPSRYLNHQTVVLEGPMRDLARTIAAGDIVRVDGSIGLHGIGRQSVWGFTCAHLRVLEHFPERTPLLSPADRSLQRTA